MGRLLSRIEVAGILGISASKLDKMRKAGEAPPAVTLGRQVRYPEEDLQVFMASLKKAVRMFGESKHTTL